MNNFERVNNQLLCNAEGWLFSIFPAGKMHGREFHLGSVYGDQGNSLKVNTHTGVWKDFADNDTGGSDLISLYAAHKSISMGEALKELDDGRGKGNTPPPPAPPKRQEWEPCNETPSKAPNLDHWQYGAPSMHWVYQTKTGAPAFYVARFENEAIGKETLPMSPCKHNDGRLEWKWKAPAKPSPIYNLPRVIEADGVIIVEGEKCAQALSEALPGITVTCWQGGTNRIAFADWTPLKGKNAIYWPDNDEPGRKAAQWAKDTLNATVLRVDPDRAKGWDCADAIEEGWERSKILEWIQAGGDEADAPQSEPEAEHEPSPPPSTPRKFPFTLCGYDRGTYYYFPDGTRQIVELSANQHTKLPLLQLAPWDWWADNFGDGEKPNFTAAASALIEQQNQCGQFDSRRIRGRGYWLDEGRTVYHAGDRLFVDGEETAIRDIDTRFIYEIGSPMMGDTAEHSCDTEGQQFLALCNSITWKSPIFGTLFAGFCAMAPICGALPWRPHIWLNGSAGSGKSWVVNNVLKPMLGDNALIFLGPTTEAGIRQKLRSDSLPIVIDEAESEDRKGQERMKSVLELARQSSSETGAIIAKGSASGSAIEFLIRSCFAFSSIGVAAQQRADTSRITSLEIVKAQSQADNRFEEIKKLRNETLGTDGFADRVRARVVANCKTIVENARKFSLAISNHFGDQRLGDQLGPMIAGAYSLQTSEALNDEKAKSWVERQDWNGFEVRADDTDEVRALNHLLEAKIQIDTEDRMRVRAVSELIRLATDPDANSDHAEDADKALQRNGIRPRDGVFFVSDSHSALARIFIDTPWAGKWKDQLRRVEGASVASSCRFSGLIQRATKVPLKVFDKNAE